MEEKIKELFADSAFLEKVIAMETPEEVTACLSENGVECSVEDIQKVRELLEKKVNGELTDEDLENVAGGCVCLIFIIPAFIGSASGLFSTLFQRRW